MGKVNFKDGRKLITSRNTNIDKTRDQMVELLQKESDTLRKANKNAQIGIAMHYKEVNAWVPAKFSDVGTPVSVWSPIDSGDTAAAYVDDRIDGFQVYVILKDKDLPDVKFLTPQKDFEPKQVTKNIFKK